MKLCSQLVVLLTATSLAAGLTLPLQPSAFRVQKSKSQFSWAATSNQGAITGTPKSFAFGGTLDLDLLSDGRLPHTGQFVGSNVSVLPGLTGGFSAGAPNSFQLTGGRITLTSSSFAIAPDGTFSTTLTPTFVDGDLQVAPPLGPSGILILDGRKLEPVQVKGQLRPSGSVLRLKLPMDLEFEFSIGAVGGTLSMPGTLVAGVRIPH